MGGAGGIISGPVGIFDGAEAAKEGQPAVAGFETANGVTSLLSGVSSAVEGGFGVAGTLGATISGDVTAGLAATSASLGLLGGAVGELSAIGMGIYSLVEGVKSDNDFTDTVQPEVQQFQTTGGDQPSQAPPAPPVTAASPGGPS